MANKNDILNALGEAREHLILSKYNEGMMLMAQITIDLVNMLIDDALVVSKGYEEDIKTLASMNVISDSTAHNFNTLIISGVQAHNGVDIPKEHAEAALEVLTNEIENVLNNENNIMKVAENLGDKSKPKKDKDVMFEYDESEPYPGDFSKDMTTDGSTPAFMSSMDDEEDFRRKEKMRKEMLESTRVHKKRSLSKLIAIIIPIAIVLVIIGTLASIIKGGARKAKTSKVIETVEINYEPETTEIIETEPTLPKEAGYYIVTGDLVKVRDQATTEGSKVYGSVSKGDTIQVKAFYNSEWAHITYDGHDAFIARRYIKKDETLSMQTEETEMTETSEIVEQESE